ncbi:MAG TPA: hypothetical protein VFY40_09260, partial [Blastocatellia bacterium]|nr:hypothetical protein [Blastocatellia bacterium]
MKITAALKAVLLCLSLLTVTAVAQSRSIEQIRIVSRWAGLGPIAHGELIVTRKSGSYQVNGKKISDELIVNLLSAIDAPVVTAPNLANLGITQEWLDANAEKAAREHAGAYFSSANKDQQALYFSSFKDPKFIEEKVLPRLYDSWHTD